MKPSDFSFFMYAIWGIISYYHFTQGRYIVGIIWACMAIYINISAHRERRREAWDRYLRIRKFVESFK